MGAMRRHSGDGGRALVGSDHGGERGGGLATD